MTVAAASDFQLRPAIFSERLSLLRLTKYRFGNPTCNLEHRRVKVSSLKHSGIDESRWLRVERKALVFFPTLNKRLSHCQRTIPAILRRGRFAIASEFLPSPISVPAKRSKNSTRSNNGSVGWKITSHILSWVKSSAAIIAMSREIAGNFPSSRKVARDPKPLIGKSSDISATNTPPDASMVDASEFVSCPARPTS